MFDGDYFVGAMNHSWSEQKILTYLQEGRQLYRAQKDETVPFPPPRFVSCWISEKCNLDCTYCYFSETNADKSHKFIDTEKFCRWLGEAKDFGVESLEFSGGGEPTLHPDFEEIILRAESCGLKLGMITHACNDMPTEYIARTFKYVRCGLDAATTETHDRIKRNKKKGYWFPRALENIRALVGYRRRGFAVGIKIVLNSINYHELDQMVAMAQNLRVDYIQIKYEHSSDHPIPMPLREQLQKQINSYAQATVNDLTKVTGTLSHQHATTQCFMSPIHTVVTATGKILQCCFFEDRPIGSIDQSFRQVWGSQKHREVMRNTTVQECDKIDCRWNYFNRKMKEIIEDPLAQASFI